MNNKSAIPVSDEIWKILRGVSTSQKELSYSAKSIINKTELSAKKISQKETDKQLKDLSASQKSLKRQTNN